MITKKLILPFCAGLLSVFLFVVSSCSDTKTAELLNRDQRFLIHYGSFEDELNLFNISDKTDIDTCIHMQDGFFYIVNGKSKKIMQFTSYGDLLSVYYNSDYNPIPSFVVTDGMYGTKRGTQKAVLYKFNAPGKITVDVNKNIYVVDQLPADRQEQDVEKNLLLRDVVLRFSSDGTFIDYLGQHGPGGTPFPYISGIYTTKNNELVVVSLTGTGFLVNWFNSEGFLLYSIPIETEGLPNPIENEQEMFFSLDKVIPDYNERMLYLKIDYYQSEIDATTGVQDGIKYDGTYIYPLNVENGIYSEPVNIPGFEETDNSASEKVAYIKTFDFMGVTESGWFFFTTPVENGYVVEIVQNNGQKIIRKKLSVANDELVYNSMCLSKEGIITALLAGEIEASVVWWRTDAVIEALIK